MESKALIDERLTTRSFPISTESICSLLQKRMLWIFDAKICFFLGKLTPLAFSTREVVRGGSGLRNAFVTAPKGTIIRLFTLLRKSTIRLGGTHVLDIVLLRPPQAPSVVCHLRRAAGLGRSCDRYSIASVLWRVSLKSYTALPRSALRQEVSLQRTRPKGKIHIFTSRTLVIVLFVDITS